MLYLFFPYDCGKTFVCRNPEYYGDEHLRNNTEEYIINRSNVSTGNYEATEDSRPEVLKQDASEAAQGSQYTFPSSSSGYSYENSQQLNPAFTHPQTSSQMQNLTPFSSVMVIDLTVRFCFECINFIFLNYMF